jgi:hypothetical protein
LVWEIGSPLVTQTYQPGGYKTFEIMDNKKRIISAAPYRDRVVLRFHPIKSQIFSVKKGILFLGYRIYPNHVRVLSSNVRRARKRMNKLVRMYAKREINLKDVNQRIMSWIGHVSHANSKRLREKVICPLVFRRDQGAVA